MRANIICIIFMICFTLISAETETETVCGDWDHLVFTRQWAQAVCLKNERSKLQPCCYIPSTVNDWTIHGVWPSKGTEKKPTGCQNCADEFDPQKIVSLENQLNKTWPTLFPGPHAGFHFWQHEWDKHGRCGVDVKALRDEYNYFATTLALHQIFNLDQVLRRSGIVPSHDKLYPINEFVKVLHDGFGADPIIQCFHDKVLNQQYIVQIEICLSKQLKPIQCPALRGVRNSTEMCMLDTPISYLPIQSGTEFPPNCDNENDDHTLYFVPAN